MSQPSQQQPKNSPHLTLVADQPLPTLQQQLTGPNSRSQLLEKLSKWVLEQVDHELLACWNNRHGWRYLICHHHGPDQSKIIAAANEMMHSPTPRIRHWRKGDLYFNMWVGYPMESSDRILIITRQAKNTQILQQLFDQALNALADPWKQAEERASHIPLLDLTRKQHA